jgi:hypothetical protein
MLRDYKNVFLIKRCFLVALHVDRLMSLTSRLTRRIPLLLKLRCKISTDKARSFFLFPLSFCSLCPSPETRLPIRELTALTVFLLLINESLGVQSTISLSCIYFASTSQHHQPATEPEAWENTHYLSGLCQVYRQTPLDCATCMWLSMVCALPFFLHCFEQLSSHKKICALPLKVSCAKGLCLTILSVWVIDFSLVYLCNCSQPDQRLRPIGFGCSIYLILSSGALCDVAHTWFNTLRELVMDSIEIPWIHW